MTQNDVMQIARNAMFAGIKVAAPMLIIGLAVGLIVAIFQATTQINEQTLVLIPKILAVVVALLIFGPWIMETMVDYTVELFGSINSFIGK